MNNLIIKSMKKFIYLMIFAVAAISCGKSGLDIESGNVLGEVEVSASAGTFTVSVETVGRWIVKEADNASWVSFDVEVLAYIPGDFNKDRSVTEDDAIYLLRYVLFPEIYPINISGDFTADGQVTEEDAIFLLRHVLFPELYPLN